MTRVLIEHEEGGAGGFGGRIYCSVEKRTGGGGGEEEEGREIRQVGL